jgi:hypothetical protein
MKYVLGILVIIIIGGAIAFFFMGNGSQQAMPAKTVPQTQPGTATTQKQGTTSKTGVITQAGGSFFIAAPGATPELIDSYSVDLAQYVGQSVTITGQFSGDTLFVGTVE